MFGLPEAARQHRDAFYTMVAEIGQDVTVRQPYAAPTGTQNAYTRALGTTSQAADTGSSTTVKAVASGPSFPRFQREAVDTTAPIGLVKSCDLVLRVRMDAVLIDSTNPYGLTIFDTAHDVIVGDQIFKVKATYNGGLPPLTPYIHWVGLIREGSSL
jgi:hypothetical protein